LGNGVDKHAISADQEFREQRNCGESRLGVRCL